MRVDRILIVVMLLLSFSLGLYIGYTSYMGAEPAGGNSNLVEEYLMEHYGVSSVEQLIEKYRQEILSRVSEYAKYAHSTTVLQDVLTQFEDGSVSRVLDSLGEIVHNTIPSHTAIEYSVPVASYYAHAGTASMGVVDPVSVSCFAVLVVSMSCMVVLLKGRKKELVLLLVVIMASLASGIAVGRVVAQSTTQRTWISAYTQGDWDVLVFKDGGYAVAVDKQWNVIAKSTDHASVIQTAIDSLSSGRILIKTGVYYLKSTLFVKDDISIIGEGWQTVLKMMDEANLPAVIRNVGYPSTRVYRVTIANLKIDVNKANQNFGTEDGKGIHLEPASECVILNVWIHNAYHMAICLSSNSTKNLIEGNVITRDSKDPVVAQDGIYVWGAYNRIIGNYFKTGYDTGIVLSSAVKNIVIGNYIEDYGNGIIAGAYASVGNVVVGNIIINADDRGINLYGDATDASKRPRDIIVANNYINGKTSAVGIRPVRLYNPSNVLIVNNVIRNVYRGIAYEAGDSIALKISNNRILDVQKDGIYIYGTDYHSEIVDNYISNCGLDGSPDNWAIRLGSLTNTLIARNRIYDSQDAPTTRGIYFEGASFSNVYVLENIISRVKSNPIYPSPPPSGVVVKRNFGYLTENSGLVYGLKNGDYIPHGLVGTPTNVILTCLNATYDGVPVIVSWNRALTNSTHIAVNILWANGTAITDPVIAVSWRAEYNP